MCVYATNLALLMVSSRGDYGHCDQIKRAIVETVPIPPSAFNPAEPALACLVGNYGLFRTHYQTVLVYGVTGPAQQDAILLQLKRLRKAVNAEAIQVLFYEKENVRTWKAASGASGGERGPETITRTAVVH
jgi:hypothetical protein